MGGAALTRPVGLLLAAGVGGIWLWQSWRRPRHILVYAVLWGACVGAAVTPWMVRNYLVFDTLVPITTVGGLNFFEANNPWVIASPTMMGTNVGAEQLPPYKDTLRMTEVERDRYLFQWARSYLRNHPEVIPKLLIAKAKRFWSLWPNLASGLAPQLGYAAFYAVFFLLALFGVWAGWRPRNGLLAPCLAVTLAAFGGALLHWASGRVRMPIEPCLALVAGIGIEHLAERRQRRRIPLSVPVPSQDAGEAPTPP